ncbi:hypothetical protein SAV14893_014940 [Streptomyces avermitilis]|uniref:Acyl-CoA carboxylase subunit epsilon n=1 Tax=Streptomyces avermitilis TaxID=33903 RepID=A0A4D4LKI5_STRAX|nr:acyl-CoA carboxylase subunit epsilon [Streptomyces avermitilis]GDY62101.1 hypothetical protein SAV14893_014940 [Streptomyces avermitilis]
MTTPCIRIEKGAATDEELAALTVLFLTRAPGPSPTPHPLPRLHHRLAPRSLPRPAQLAGTVSDHADRSGCPRLHAPGAAG